MLGIKWEWRILRIPLTLLPPLDLISGTDGRKEARLKLDLRAVGKVYKLIFTLPSTQCSHAFFAAGESLQQQRGRIRKQCND